MEFVVHFGHLSIDRMIIVSLKNRKEKPQGRANEQGAYSAL